MEARTGDFGEIDVIQACRYAAKKAKVQWKLILLRDVKGNKSTLIREILNSLSQIS